MCGRYFLLSPAEALAVLDDPLVEAVTDLGVFEGHQSTASWSDVWSTRTPPSRYRAFLGLRSP